MARHVNFTIATDVPIYFCDSHSPLLSGQSRCASNENTNGLLRQYMPKGTDLSVQSKDDLDRVPAALRGSL
ncbi:MAG: IS30 family transposase [Acidobacteria bacterium]|nr:IS30 family transposase [Acidobacteriota bacterium]